MTANTPPDREFWLKQISAEEARIRKLDREFEAETKMIASLTPYQLGQITKMRRKTNPNAPKADRQALLEKEKADWTARRNASLQFLKNFKTRLEELDRASGITAPVPMVKALTVEAPTVVVPAAPPAPLVRPSAVPALTKALTPEVLAEKRANLLTRPIIPAAPAAPAVPRLITPPSSAPSVSQEILEESRAKLNNTQLLRQQLEETRRKILAPAPTRRLTFSDSFRGFKRDTYKLSGVGSIEGLYNAIEEIRAGRRDATAIIRYINEKGEPRYTSIMPEHLFTLNDFETRLEKLTSGDVVGSDAVGDGSFLDPSYLSILRFDLEGFGRKSGTFFAIDEDQSIRASSLCLWRAIFSQIPYDESRAIPQDITNLKECNELLIKLYGHSIHCYADWTSSASNTNAGYAKVMIGGVAHALSPIETKELVTILEPTAGMPVVKIVYYDNHYIRYTGIKAGQFYHDRTKQIIHVLNGEIVAKYRRQAQNERLKAAALGGKTETFTTEIVTFDVETRYDDAYIGLLRPYSIAWTFKKRGYFYMGDDCVERMLTDVLADSANCLICLLGYNSSRFDNLLLLPVLLKLDMLTDVFYQKNSVLNIRWGGRHTVHDICRFTLSSLDRACAEFRTLFRKVGGFKHEDIQRHYNKTGEIATFFHSEECAARQTSPYSVCYACDAAEEGKTVEKYGTHYREPTAVKEEIAAGLPCKCQRFRDLVTYNLFDVFSTEELYRGIEKVMLDNEAIKGNLFDNKTIGSVIYKLFAASIVDRKLQIPNLELPDYKRVRSGLFAGRTQCYKGVSHDLTRKNRYVMLDVKSLYPYVMLNRDFPAGKVENLDYKTCSERGLIGFYNCRVNQSGLNRCVLPKREEGTPLDWEYRGDITVFINTVDIRCLIDAGATVEILKKEDGSDDGFAFSGKIKGEVLFECLAKWKKIKEDQDVLKAKGSSDYNVVLRNMAKTFLNSLSGKVIENIHLDETRLIRTAADMADLLKSGAKIDKLQLSAVLSGSAGLITFEKDEEKEFKRQNRPIYLGTLIYAYSRDHMYRSVLANYDVIYQDTDSALLSRDEYDRFAREQPDLLGEDFGKFALEDFSELFDSYITLSPKNYFIMGEKNGEYGVIKKGFKGVALTKDKYIHDPAAYSWHISRTYTGKREVIYDVMERRGFDLYNGDIDYGVENEARAAAGLPLIEKPKTVCADYRRFIDSILENGVAYVLTSSLVKPLKNNSTGTAAGGLYQRFLLKKIKVPRRSFTPFVRPTPEVYARITNRQPQPQRPEAPPQVVKQAEAFDCTEVLHSLSGFVIGPNLTPVKFSEPNTIRVDFGGPAGNRAFNFKSYREYVSSCVVEKLIERMGESFNLNEYPSNSAMANRVWLDIDMHISEAKAEEMAKRLDEIIVGGDNKVLRSKETGKLHIVLNIQPARPYTVYNRVMKGSKYVLKPTGEIHYDYDEESVRILKTYLGRELRKVLGGEAFSAEWEAAFDVGAKGLRAPHSAKVKAGQIVSTSTYKPLGSKAVVACAKDVYDCSIYKPVTGSIRRELVKDIDAVSAEFAAAAAAKEKKMAKLMKKYNNGSYELDGIVHTVDQKFINLLLRRMPNYKSSGRSWRAVVWNVAAATKDMAAFSPSYLLGEWSQRAPGEYSADNNAVKWKEAKAAAVSTGVNALMWLIAAGSQGSAQ